MPNPKRRHSKSRRNMRRAHDFLTTPSLSKCTHCGAATMPHRVCAGCGHYKGKQVIAAKNAA